MPDEKTRDAIDLSELDALMTQATPGPLVAVELYDDDGDLCAIEVRSNGGLSVLVQSLPTNDEVLSRMHLADVAAIVALRNAWPELRERLAAAEADRVELARLRRVAARAAHLLRSRGSAAEEFASSALREELRGEP